MKKTLIITIITVIILALIGGGVFWYLNTKNNENTANDDSQVVQNEENNKIENNKEEVKNEEDPNAKYQGETIKEADGWKKYRNEYFGIEFRFKDEGGEIGIFDSSGRIVLGDKKDIQGNPKIYLFFSELTEQYPNPESKLYDYLKVGWNGYQEQAQFIAITPQTNEQGTNYYSVSAKVNGGMQSPGITYIDTKYYFEYPTNLQQKDKHINYIQISSGDNDLTKSIISSFNFLSN